VELAAVADVRVVVRRPEVLRVEALQVAVAVPERPDPRADLREDLRVVGQRWEEQAG